MARKLSSESKYRIADALAGTYETLVDAPEVIRRATYADIINRAQFSVKGTIHTLQSFCTQDDAQHITRLVMRRLTQPAVVQRQVASIDM